MEAIPENLMPLYQRLVWDIASHEALMDPAIQAQFGLHPASDEVTEMEHDAADCRIAAVYPLLLQIRIEAALAAQVVNTAILNSHLPVNPEHLDPELLSALFAVTATSIVAGLVSEGILVTNYPEVPHV